MKIIWNQEEGFRLDIPYSEWLIFCVGAAMLVRALSYFADSVRWW